MGPDSNLLYIPLLNVSKELESKSSFHDKKYRNALFLYEQGKKVFKATAVQCAHLFLFRHQKSSYSGELLTARTAVKILQQYIFRDVHYVLL